ncbi:hypothetical protein C0Q70_09551 [Pomacea canaliculata]|uniref:Uncharacterized protein n=1 Tax=Pomacea canaliculata TaxID=400727 RepID=A0A2T7PA41_POMCA|nr:hypothetical protein C0Q70_09551 [Pomacea canaliculata]
MSSTVISRLCPQHCLTSFGAMVSVALILQKPLCMSADPVGVSQIQCTIFMVGGIATLLQSTFGISFNLRTSSTTTAYQERSEVRNGTNGTSTLPEDPSEVWQKRQSPHALHSFMPPSPSAADPGRRHGGLVVPGCAGLQRHHDYFPAADQSPGRDPHHHPSGAPPFRSCGGEVVQAMDSGPNRAFLSESPSDLHSCLVAKILPWKGLQGKRINIRIFGLFPVLLGMGVTWLLCWVLTITDALPREENRWGHDARTDAKASVLIEAQWIRVPYPGQWGLPTVSTGAVFGMLAGVLSSMIESVGDYYACARLSNAPPPPPHAINRGLGVEGIACVLAGAFGSANGTTSFSENIAAIGITKVASRRVIQTAGLLLIIMGCTGKVGAFFVSLPDPVVGGMFLCMFSMITSVGLSNIQYVNMRKTRNLCVLGLSLFLGLWIPKWVSANTEHITTGSEVGNQIVSVLLSTNMFVGGFIGFVLDNLLPGTPKDRGITLWRQETTCPTQRASRVSSSELYRVPFFSSLIDRFPFWGKLPFCPPASATTSSPGSADHDAQV